MELSSPRFKAFAVSLGFTVWFVIISLAVGVFSFYALAIFLAIALIVTQVVAVKLSKVLEIFAIYNTKVFLGILFVLVVSIYGVFFRLLKIDVLRLKKRQKTYWLEMEQLKVSRIFKQF